MGFVVAERIAKRSKLTSHQIRRISTESTVPNPSLMANEDPFKSEVIVATDRPYFHSRISGACCQESGRFVSATLEVFIRSLTAHPGSASIV